MRNANIFVGFLSIKFSTASRTIKQASFCVNKMKICNAKETRREIEKKSGIY